MNYTTGVLLAIAAAGIGIAVLVQFSQYFRGRQLISGRQMILRMVMAVLLLGVIGLSFFGAVYFRIHQQLVPELVFWSVLVLMAAVVMILAVLDLRKVRRTHHQVRAELHHRVAQLRGELKEITEAGRPGGDTKKPSENSL